MRKYILVLCIVICNIAHTQQELQEYLLPQTHSLYTTVTNLFSSSSVLDSPECMQEAGFIIRHNQPSGMKILQHRLLPGYLIKAYCNTMHQGTQWAVDRCLGAQNIRILIQEEHLQYCLVPDKWIYCVGDQVILLVEEIHILPPKENKTAWKSASKQHIYELFVVLDHGFGSCYLKGNVPYTREGKFAFIDTAYPYREHVYARVRRYFSPKMQSYWDDLIAHK